MSTPGRTPGRRPLGKRTAEVSQATADAIAALLREDIGELRDALERREKLLPANRRAPAQPTLRVIEGGGEDAARRQSLRTPFAMTPAELLRSGAAMPSLRLVPTSSAQSRANASSASSTA